MYWLLSHEGGRGSCVGMVQIWEASPKPRTGADDEKGSEELSVLEEDPPEEGWKESS